MACLYSVNSLTLMSSRPLSCTRSWTLPVFSNVLSIWWERLSLIVSTAYCIVDSKYFFFFFLFSGWAGKWPWRRGLHHEPAKRGATYQFSHPDYHQELPRSLQHQSVPFSSLPQLSNLRSRFPALSCLLGSREHSLISSYNILLIRKKSVYARKA